MSSIISFRKSVKVKGPPPICTGRITFLSFPHSFSLSLSLSLSLSIYIYIYRPIYNHLQTVQPKGKSFTANLGTKAAVLPKGRPSTANSGTMVAVLLGMDSCCSFPLLSAYSCIRPCRACNAGEALLPLIYQTMRRNLIQKLNH